ncbi:hypothetical protein [Gordonia oryzae]|uniref:hypothetical protein n=1 Tax=Gordonia oryzae TaxID=2487349 RepID=UPI0016147282|nr:hypothetical protein [Gordonia oryzae]
MLSGGDILIGRVLLDYRCPRGTVGASWWIVGGNTSVGVAQYGTVVTPEGSLPLPAPKMSGTQREEGGGYYE